MATEPLIEPPTTRSTRYTDDSVLAGDELHRRAKAYMALYPGTDYEAAIKHVLRTDPALARRYTAQE